MSDELSVSMESCLVFAARYAHSRNTGAALFVVKTILANWDSLSESAKVTLKREAKNEAVYNLDEWARVINR